MFNNTQEEELRSSIISNLLTTCLGGFLTGSRVFTGIEAKDWDICLPIKSLSEELTSNLLANGFVSKAAKAATSLSRFVHEDFAIDVFFVNEKDFNAMKHATKMMSQLTARYYDAGEVFPQCKSLRYMIFQQFRKSFDPITQTDDRLDIY